MSNEASQDPPLAQPPTQLDEAVAEEPIAVQPVTTSERVPLPFEPLPDVADEPDPVVLPVESATAATKDTVSSLTCDTTQDDAPGSLQSTKTQSLESQGAIGGTVPLEARIPSPLSIDQIENESRRAIQRTETKTSTTPRSRRRSLLNDATPEPPQRNTPLLPGVLPNVRPPTLARPDATVHATSITSPASYRRTSRETGQSPEWRQSPRRRESTDARLDLLSLEDDDPNLFTIDENALHHCENDCVLDQLARILVSLPDAVGVHPTPHHVHEPTPLLNSTVVRDSVERAAKIVANTLQSNLWPSPFQWLSGGDDDDDDDDGATPDLPARRASSRDAATAHATHMAHVGTALEGWARNVILPELMQELKWADMDPTTAVVRDDQLALRTVVGCLVLLREVLVQNKVAVFGPDRHESQADGAARKILATTIVLAGLSEMEGEVDGLSGNDLTESFLEVMELYDSGHDEFAHCLDEITDSTEAVHTNGKRMRDDEVPSWRRTSNLHRERHPLVRQPHARDRFHTGGPSMESVGAAAFPTAHAAHAHATWNNVPAPTAVYLTSRTTNVRSRLPTRQANKR